MRPFGAEVHASRHLPSALDPFLALNSRHLRASRGLHGCHGSLTATAKGVSTRVRAGPSFHGSSHREHGQDAEGGQHSRQHREEGFSDSRDPNTQQRSASSSVAGSTPSPSQLSSSTAAPPSPMPQSVPPPSSLTWSSASEPKPISCIAKGIKAANEAVKVLKSAEGFIRRLQDPHDLWFGTGCGLAIGFKAAKRAAKGLKYARQVAMTLQKKNLLGHSGMASKRMQGHMSTMIKGLNAFYGAFKVLQFAKGLGHHPQPVHFLHWSLLFQGYELSKSVLHVLEVLVKWKGGALMALGKGYTVLKGTVGTLSVVAKAVSLYRELYVLIHKIVIPGGTLAAFGMVSKDFNRQSNQTLVDTSIQYVGNMVLSLRPSVKNMSSSLKIMPLSRLFTGQQLSTFGALMNYLSVSSEDNTMDHGSIDCPSDIFSLAIPICCGHGYPDKM